MHPPSINPPLLSLDSILIMPLPGLCIYIADIGTHRNDGEVGRYLTLTKGKEISLFSSEGKEISLFSCLQIVHCQQFLQDALQAACAADSIPAAYFPGSVLTDSALTSNSSNIPVCPAVRGLLEYFQKISPNSLTISSVQGR